MGIRFFRLWEYEFQDVEPVSAPNFKGVLPSSAPILKRLLPTFAPNFKGLLVTFAPILKGVLVFLKLANKKNLIKFNKLLFTIE